MASAGRRRKIVEAVRDAIRTANGGVDFFYDLSGAMTVTLLNDTTMQRVENSKGVAVRVWDGAEQHSRGGVKGTRTVQLEVLVRVMVADNNLDLVLKLNDVIADIILAVGRNKALGGFCTSMGVGSIDAPTYDFSQSVAATTVRIKAEYDYDEGSTR